MGQICVFKYYDDNQNGKYEPALGDRPLSGWNIWLNGTGVKLHKVTGEDGKICFSGLMPGNYEVDEEERGGWVGIENGSDPVKVCLKSGMCTTVNFGNYQPPVTQKDGSISGYKYEDMNLNKAIDPSDKVVTSEWKVELYYYDAATSTWVFLSDTKTVNGFYQFTGLDISLTYKVVEVPQDGWIEVISSREGLTIPGPHGDQYNNTDFLNARYGSISGIKWEDVNLNKVIDGPDRVAPAPPDWTVELWSRTPRLGSGSWLTSHDREREIQVHRPRSLPGVQGPRDAPERMGGGHLRVGILKIPVSGGVQYNNTDFLNTRYGSICGTKWEDINLNKVIDGPDRVAPAPPDWTIELWYQDPIDFKWKLLASQSTVSGKYWFTGLDPYLEYKVQEMPQSGWVEVITESGILKIPVSGGVQYNKTDFLNTRYGSISGIKWEDINLNKVIDGPDRVAPAPPDWTVDLWSRTPMTWQYDWLARTTTVNGKYWFCGLDPYRQYKVQEMPQSAWVEVITDRHPQDTRLWRCPVQQYRLPQHEVRLDLRYQVRGHEPEQGHRRTGPSSSGTSRLDGGPADPERTDLAVDCWPASDRER